MSTDPLLATLRRDVIAAEARIRPHVRLTPLEPALGALGGGLHFKLENQQRTGSFKIRGAMNKLLTLDSERRARGVVAASTGNHGAAVACGASVLACPALIFAPENAAASKLAAVESHGAEIVRVGADCVETEAAARAHALEHGMTYISPYNDADVIAGQGTIGCELDAQLEDLDVVFASVGGGGLIAGLGGYLKGGNRELKVIACSPKNSCVMHDSLKAGRILDLPSEPTLSDGTAGGIESDSVTFELCQRVIDEFVLVSEDEIRAAVRFLVGEQHQLVEGAAGVALAAYRKLASRFEGARVAVVLCGANIEARVLRELL